MGAASGQGRSSQWKHLWYALLRKMPSPMPYMELLRLHKPAGILYIYLPYLFGSLVAFSIRDPVPPPSMVISTAFYLFLIGVIVRGIGCTWNDICDRDFDRHSARGRIRPIARGAVSVKAAYLFLFVQYLVLLSTLGSPSKEWLYLFPALVSGHIYPYAKRFTTYAQVVLGFSLSLGMLFGCAIADIDPISLGLSKPGVGMSALAVSYICWTVVYDTIYAFQDIADDKKMGLKAVSVGHEAHIKTLLYSFAAAQEASLLLAGMMLNAGLLYFVGNTSVAILLYLMVAIVNLKDPVACWWWFKWGSLLIGGSLAVSLSGEYLTRAKLI